MRRFLIVALALGLIGLVTVVLGCMPIALVSVAPVQPVAAPIAQPDQPSLAAPAIIQPSAPKLSAVSRKILDGGGLESVWVGTHE